MEKNLFFLFSCVFVFVSCSRNDYEHIEYAINTMKDNVRTLDTSVIKETYYPSDIYSVGNDILIINRDKSDKVIYRYDSEMSFKGAFFSYGKATDEFLFVDKKLKSGSDSTLYLYTNWFDCTEFLLDKHKIMVTDKFHILKEVRNDVIILNDSLLFYRALQKDKPFHIYNYVKNELVCEFGEFPISMIQPGTDADRDNICLCNSVYNMNGRRLISFYESIPIIRIYDMVAYNLVREIRITDSEKQTTSLDGYYEGAGIIYFVRPLITGKNIYSLFINARSDDEFIEQTVLIKMDLDGNLVSKYTLDRFCLIYTVSDDGMFYGIATSNGQYILCKTQL